jgi:hypothetical protein
MISFKEFIQEKAVDKEPDFKEVEVKQAIDMLNEHCKDALWMLKQDSPIYRGEISEVARRAKSLGFLTVDTSATTRESQNTMNYYTMLLDNNPAMKDFPKRSKSFIASTSKSRAQAFADMYSTLVMIPFDGVKIGFVNNDDMWDTKIDLFHEYWGIRVFNDSFIRMKLRPTLESFKKFDKELKAGNEDAIERFKDGLDIDVCNKSWTDNFLKLVFEAYSPSKTGFTAHTTKTMPRNSKTSEVWVGGKIMYITMQMWDQLRRAMK